MIASPNLLPLVIKYANKLGRIHLSAKLSELMPQFEEQVGRIEDNSLNTVGKLISYEILGKAKRETHE